MTTEATLWAEAQRLALVRCVICRAPDHDRYFDNNCSACGGTGEVRSDVYRAIERAITVPCPRCAVRGVIQHGLHDNWCSDGTGRVVRKQPGVMACPSRRWANEVQHPPECACSGSGTVPDPSEAGVVARAEALGRLVLIETALGHAEGEDVLFRNERSPFAHALYSNDYTGALAATLEGVRALTAVEAT